MLAAVIWFGSSAAWAQGLHAHGVVLIEIEGRAVAAGTWITWPATEGVAVGESDIARGSVRWVLTKASETSPTDAVAVRWRDGRTDGATWVATDRASDLRLLRVEPAGVDGRSERAIADRAVTDRPVAIRLNDHGEAEPASDALPAGTFVMVPLVDQESPVRGIVSGPARAVPSSAKLGVFFADGVASPVVRAVQAGSGADAAGFVRGDLITAIDGVATATPLDVIDALRSEPRYAGDRVRVSLERRAGFSVRAMEVVAVLGRVPDDAATREGRLERHSGPVNARRDGFALVWPTDAAVPADRVGGPAFALDGTCLGVVIARAGRTETRVLPLSEVASALRRMLRVLNEAEVRP